MWGVTFRDYVVRREVPTSHLVFGLTVAQTYLALDQLLRDHRPAVVQAALSAIQSAREYRPSGAKE